MAFEELIVRYPSKLICFVYDDGDFPGVENGFDELVSSLKVVQKSLPQGSPLLSYIGRRGSYVFPSRKHDLRSFDSTMAEAESVRPGDSGLQNQNTPRRSSLTEYSPQGILKRGWLEKHRETIPAVVVLIVPFDVDQSLESWNSYEAEVLKKLDQLRKNLGNRRLVRTALLLVQNCDYPRDMEVPKKVELKQDRIDSLRRSADIDAKSIVLIHTADFVRIDKTVSPTLANFFHSLNELSEEYYSLQSKRLRENAKLLDISSPGGLAMLTRVNFKIAQYYEARRNAKALKHYENAYDAIVELSVKRIEAGSTSSKQIYEFPYEANEIRCTAECIHYRLITLHVASRHVHAVLGQFKKHIAAMKKLIDEYEKRFLYYQWLSKQYFVFSEFISEIRPALALAHLNQFDRLRCNNVYYLYIALKFAIARRELAQHLKIYGGKKNAGKDQALRRRSLDQLIRKYRLKIQPSVYVGAFPTCQSQIKHSTIAENVVNEVQLKTLQEIEGRNNQSAEILSLLSQISSLISNKADNTVKIGRRQAEVFVKMSHEHILMENFPTALSYLEKAYPAFIKEKWPFLMKNTADLVLSNLDTLNAQCELFQSFETRKALLNIVVSHLPSESEPETTDVKAELSILKKLLALPLKQNCSEDIVEISLDKLSNAGILDWSYFFLPRLCCVGESSELHIRFTTSLTGIAYQRLEIFFSDSRYDKTIVNKKYADGHKTKVGEIVESLEVLTAEGMLEMELPIIALPPLKDNRIQRVQIIQVALLVCAQVGGIEDLNVSQFKLTSVEAEEVSLFANFDPNRLGYLTIHNPEPKTDIDFALSRISPLQGEVLLVDFSIKQNDEKILEPQLKFSLNVPAGVECLFSARIDNSAAFHGEKVDLEKMIEDLLPKNVDSKFKTNTLGIKCLPNLKSAKINVVITFELTYKLAGTGEFMYSVKKSESIEFMCPFQASFKVVPMIDSHVVPFQQGKQEKIIVQRNCPFLVILNLVCNKELRESLILEEIIREYYDIFSETNSDHESLLPIKLGPCEQFTLPIEIKASDPIENYPLGSARFMWKREDEANHNEFVLEFPELTVAEPHFTYTLASKPSIDTISVGGCRDLSLGIQNHTQAMQTVTASLVDKRSDMVPFDDLTLNESFFVLGESEHIVLIGPGDSEILNWKLVKKYRSEFSDMKIYIKVKSLRYETVQYLRI